MEEERYQNRDGIFDNKINDYVMTEDIVKLLNNSDKLIEELEQQDKHIKELEEENRKLEYARQLGYNALMGCEDDYQNLKQETTQLKQQLHDLPKKIVGEIRKEIEFPLYVHPDFDEFECVFDIDKLLDTILKKYGGENE